MSNPATLRFEYTSETAPVDEASANAFVSMLDATGATDWRIEFTRTFSQEHAVSYRKTALDALLFANQLFSAEPPMPSVLTPLIPKSVD